MRMLLISLTTLASAFAMGKASTEYYFQPAADANAVEVIYNMTTTPSEIEDAGVTDELDSTANDFIVRYIRGIDDKSAWGAYTFFGSREYDANIGGVKSSNTADGMGDIHVFYKMFTDDQWHFRADVGINTEKAKNALGIPDNRSTGGSSLNLRGGRMWTKEAWNYGADLSYLLLLERTTDDAAGNIKETGGDIIKLAGFGEYNHGAGFLGAELGYNVVNEIKRKAGGATATTDPENFVSAGIYGTWEFTEMVTALVRFDQAMRAGRDISPGTAEQKATTDTGISIGARFNF